MEREKKVRPDCINASNPFHECKEYCVQRSPGSKLRAGGGRSPAQNGEGSKEVGEGRHVDPTCVNASNPFHRCADYCSQRTPDAKKRADGGRSVERKEGVTTGENRKVDPRCKNASNPFHECAEYCSPRSHEMGRAEGGMSAVISDGSRGGVKIVTEKRDVHPQCINASNPYHKCAEYCSQRIREAT